MACNGSMITAVLCGVFPHKREAVERRAKPHEMAVIICYGSVLRGLSIIIRAFIIEPLGLIRSKGVLLFAKRFDRQAK